MTNKSTSSENHGLKKGPWTPEEDQKLVDYIQKYGYGKWRTLPKNAGLKRCGKSCRLRWTNYLRPDIKRGRFSLEEEEVIIQLHSALGNKWSTIAANLPGRTDNEIKNYWNTHIKKKLMKMGIDPVTHTPRLDILQLASILNSSLHNSPQFNNLDHFSFGRVENPNHLYILNLLTTLLSCQNKNLNDSNYNVHQNQSSGNDNNYSNSLHQLQNPQFKFTMESQLMKTKLMNQIAPIATSFSNIQQPKSSTINNILENQILSNIEEMPNFDLSSLFSTSPSPSSTSNLKSQSSTTFVNGTIEGERYTYDNNNFMMYNTSQMV